MQANSILRDERNVFKCTTKFRSAGFQNPLWKVDLALFKKPRHPIKEHKKYSQRGNCSNAPSFNFNTSAAHSGSRLGSRLRKQQGTSTKKTGPVSQGVTEKPGEFSN